MTDSPHLPVLLEESVRAVVTNTDGLYVDACGGAGGHSSGILSQLAPSAKLLVLDRDPTAIALLQQKFESDSRVAVRQERFGNVRTMISSELNGRAHGIFADLGVSSMQIDDAERGFSFRYQQAPLDLRMSATGPTAVDWLATQPVAHIAEAFLQFGDFRPPIHFAPLLHEAAKARQIATVGDAITVAFGESKPSGNTLARFFQTLRIAVNNEYEELNSLLRTAREMILPGGRLAVITFHSGEARLVKNEFRQRTITDGVKSQGARYWREEKQLEAAPTKAEIKRNPRAASAILRVATREETV